MPAPDDEFELVLRRCQERLAEIDLHLPGLEGSAPRPPVYSLTAALDEPAAPASAAVAPPPPAPEPELPTIEAPPEDVSPAPPEPPSAPLWRAAPSPEPEARPAAAAPVSARDARWRASLAAAAVAVGAGGLWLARRAPAGVSLDVDQADGLAVRQDGDLIVAQGLTLLTLTPAGRTLEKTALDAPVADLSWDQGSLWSVDGRTPTVLERREGARPTSFRLNHVPGAVYAHDKYLWTSEKDGRALHQFLISRSILGALLQPLDLYELPGLNPETFAIDDDGTLWLVDQASRRLYRLKPENGTYKPLASTPLSPLIGPDGDIRSLRLKDDAVWILVRPAGSSRSILRRLVLSRLDWTPA